MHHKSTPLTAWLLGGIATCLLLAEAGQLLLSAQPGGSSELLWGGLTLAVGAGLSASADARWRD